MADATGAVGAAALGAAATLSGVPPGDVIVWALIGGLVSVWASEESAITVSIRWACGVAMRLGISAAAGIVLSALAIAVAPHYSTLEWLGWAPQWALAAVLSASIFKVAPIVMARVERMIGGKNVPTD